MMTGYFQYEVAYGDWERNADRVREAVSGLRGPGLLVLPELAFTGYDFVDASAARAAAETVAEGRTFALLRELAQATGLTIVAGYPELFEGAVYNSAACVEPSGTAHNYRKLHLFNREKTLFAPGDQPPRAFDTALGRIGMMVCFDWFFPEVTRCLALDGAALIAHPSNLVLPWCQRAMFARSVENRVFTITANRIGTETQAGRSLTFTGGSQVMSPKGETLAQAPTDAPDAQLVSVSLDDATNKQLNEFNHLFNDRRHEFFSTLG